MPTPPIPPTMVKGLTTETRLNNLIKSLLTPTWVSPGLPGGWSGTLRYRWMPWGSVELDMAVTFGAVVSKGTSPSGNWIFTLPGAYSPPHKTSFAPYETNASITGPQTPAAIVISTAGVVNYYYLDPGTTGLDLHVTFPLT